MICVGLNCCSLMNVTAFFLMLVKDVAALLIFLNAC